MGQVCSCSDIDTDPSSYRKIIIRGGKKRNFYGTKKCELYTVHLQVEYLFMAKLIFFILLLVHVYQKQEIPILVELLASNIFAFTYSATVLTHKLFFNKILCM